MSFKELFDDQRTFNKLIWDKEKFQHDETAVVDRLRHLTLGMVEESLEFIRTFDFKSHRRSKSRLQNVAHSHEELIDMFKYWLSLADVADFPIEKLGELYYAKSRVVQYRYQDEWLKSIDRPSVVVDIDEVLADYISGMSSWAREHAARLLHFTPPDMVRMINRLEHVREHRTWLDWNTSGVGRDAWQTVKHDFSTRGGWRTLPVISDASPFLWWCREQGWIIILITSRPIDRYPNIFTDTLTWLTEAGLPFDHLWWTDKKDERLEDAHVQMRSQIVFAVDDNRKFVNQFAEKGVKTYWLVRGNKTLATDFGPNITVVTSLTELMEREK
jgi:hypothetical protein